MKRIVSIQDISCLGKCALTVALPVISAMGVEAAVLPTAMLSVHSDFPTFVSHDLSPAVPAVIEHWKRERFTFDGIYTGYLGGPDQAALISGFVDAFKKDGCFYFLDPVMGDNGSLYAGLPPELPAAMAALCRKADVIVPNITEAALLLGCPYPGEDAGEEALRALLTGLAALGCPKVVLTGVRLGEDEVGVLGYDSETGEFFRAGSQKLPQRFPGTGDCLSSVCVGALARGLPLPEALRLAVDFTCESLRRSIADPAHRWYGVNFEEAIPLLVSRLAAREE